MDIDTEKFHYVFLYVKFSNIVKYIGINLTQSWIYEKK